jgi:hypothetical protein
MTNPDISDIYRQIEDWHGVVDPKYRGTGQSLELLTPHNTGVEVTYFGQSEPGLDHPDIQVCLAEFPTTSWEDPAGRVQT